MKASEVKSKILGVGKYLPDTVIANKDLEKLMDTSDDWIKTRSGIKERRYANRFQESTSHLGTQAAIKALENSDTKPEDVDFIIFATLSPDYYFPGSGVLMQRQLGIKNVGALDVRAQCTGFIYAISIADQYIKTGQYKRILVVGAESQTGCIDFSTSGREIAVLFGDGAGAVVMGPSDSEQGGILSTHLHADGEAAEDLALINPGFHSGAHSKEYGNYKQERTWESTLVTEEMLENQDIYPFMNGSKVFLTAVQKFPEVIKEALEANQKALEDLDLVIPHQANVRITDYIRKNMKLPESKVFSNIHKYGNTTAASIPIALCEALEEKRIKEGDLVCLAAFGAGFTWGSALISW